MFFPLSWGNPQVMTKSYPYMKSFVLQTSRQYHLLSSCALGLPVVHTNSAIKSRRGKYIGCFSEWLYTRYGQAYGIGLISGNDYFRRGFRYLTTGMVYRNLQSYVLPTKSSRLPKSAMTKRHKYRTPCYITLLIPCQQSHCTTCQPSAHTGLIGASVYTIHVFHGPEA